MTQGATSLPYETAAPNDYQWTSAAYDQVLAGSMAVTLESLSGIRTARVAGPCPRCHHQLNVSEVLDAVTGERSGALRTTGEPGGSDGANEDQYVAVVATCQCGEPHEGRPEGTTFGCGINFLVEIAVD